MLKYKIEKITHDKATIFFSGSIDENANKALSPLLSEISKTKTCHLNLREIEYINSLGLRMWLYFFREFQTGRDIIFEECAPNVINQINFTKQFIGPGKINSFYGYLFCPECGYEKNYLFSAEKNYEELKQELSSIKCDKCPSMMELEDEEEDYFNFLISA